jgi:hypothetical protein
MSLVLKLGFCVKELVLDVNLMHWLAVAILVLEISSMFSIICGFLLFVLNKTYMNMVMWFVKVKNWKFKASNGHL